MKFLITNADGTIERTITCATVDDGILQLSSSGFAVYQVDETLGLIDDNNLVITAGVLTVKAGVTATIQNAGIAVTAIDLSSPPPEPT